MRFHLIFSLFLCVNAITFHDDLRLTPEQKALLIAQGNSDVPFPETKDSVSGESDVPLPAEFSVSAGNAPVLPMGRAFNLWTSDFFNGPWTESYNVFESLPDTCIGDSTVQDVTKAETVYLESSKDVESYLAISANVEMQKGMFSASVSSSAGFTSSSHEDRRYQMLTVSHTRETQTMNTECWLDGVLSTTVKTLLIDPLPETLSTNADYLQYKEVMDSIGTHFVTTVITGAQMKSSFSAVSSCIASQTDFTATACAKFEGWGTSASGCASVDSESSKSACESTQITEHAFRGGDSTAQSQLVAGDYTDENKASILTAFLDGASDQAVALQFRSLSYLIAVNSSVRAANWDHVMEDFLGCSIENGELFIDGACVQWPTQAYGSYTPTVGKELKNMAGLAMSHDDTAFLKSWQLEEEGSNGRMDVGLSYLASGCEDHYTSCQDLGNNGKLHNLDRFTLTCPNLMGMHSFKMVNGCNNQKRRFKIRCCDSVTTTCYSKLGFCKVTKDKNLQELARHSVECGAGFAITSWRLSDTCNKGSKRRMAWECCEVDNSDLYTLDVLSLDVVKTRFFKPTFVHVAVMVVLAAVLLGALHKLVKPKGYVAISEPVLPLEA